MVYRRKRYAQRRHVKRLKTRSAYARRRPRAFYGGSGRGFRTTPWRGGRRTIVGYGRTYPAISRFLPFTNLCRFVYTETISINPSANPTGSAQKLLYPMHISDPLLHSDNVHAPAQFDEAMTYYKYCIVQSCKTTVRRVTDAAVQSYCYWGMVIDEVNFPKYDVTDRTHDELSMMAGLPRLRYSGSTTNFKPGVNGGNVMTKYFKPTKFFRITKAQLNQKCNNDSDDGAFQESGDYQYHGNKTAVPLIKLFAVSANIGTHDPGLIYFQVRMEFICKLTRREELEIIPT